MVKYSDSEHITDTQARMLLAIIQAGKNGIKGKDLEVKTGFSRGTLISNRKILEEKKLIECQTKGGKKTTYYSRIESPDSLSSKFKFMRDDLFYMLQGVTTMWTMSPFFISRFSSQQGIERFLFEFCLRAGIILTYILLQAMNPSIVKILPGRNIVSDRIKEYYLTKWISNMIPAERILMMLRQSLYSLGCNYQVDSGIKPESYSFYELEEDSMTYLLQRFSNLFPDVVKELERRTSDSIHDEDRVKNRLDYLKRRALQFRCSHSWQSLINKEEKSYSCGKCGLEVLVKLSDVITSKRLLQFLNSTKPQTTTCKNHEWVKESRQELGFFFWCPLCDERINIEAETREKLELIDEEVSIEVGIQNVRLCNDIEYFFHINPDKVLYINDFVEFFKSHRNTIMINDEKVFRKAVDSILDILLQYEFISMVNTGQNKSDRTFIRKSKIDLR